MPPERGLQHQHQHRQRMAADREGDGREGEVISQQPEFPLQVPQGQQQQAEGHQKASPGRPCGGARQRESTGRRVGATPMLDQLPTAIPIVSATANQSRVLPPKKIRATRGRRVVSEV